MRGAANPPPALLFPIHLEPCVPVVHPGRQIRPLIVTDQIRLRCTPRDAEEDRPSISLTPRSLALRGGARRGMTSELALVREWPSNLVLQWLVGLAVDPAPWAHSTCSQNRTQRVKTSGLLAPHCAETVARAMTRKRGSPQTTLDRLGISRNGVAAEPWSRGEASGPWIRTRVLFHRGREE